MVRLALQIWFALLSLVFVTGGVIAGHVAVYQLLAARLPPAGAAGCVAGGDLFLALVFVMVAVNSKPSTTEREAREISRTASAQILPSLAWTRLISLLIGMIMRRRS